MKTDKTRVAIIGAGLISRNSHLPAALSSRRVQVTAIIDTDTGRASRLARDFGIEVTIGADVGDAVDKADAAIIATPNNSHAKLAVACLSRGVSTLIEKPLATSADEGRTIVAAAKESGATLAIGYATRFRENVRFMKELLDSNYFGRVRRFVNRFGTPGGWSPASAYNLAKDSAGGGVLVVTGTHFLDRMLHFWGYPDSATMKSDAKGGPEANCQCVFEYSSGLMGSAIFSKTAGFPSGTVIDTERGSVVLGEFDDSDIVLRPHDNPGMEHIVRRRSTANSGADSFKLQMENFVSACRGEASPLVDGHQGVESLRLIEQLYENGSPLSDSWYGNGNSR